MKKLALVLLALTSSVQAFAGEPKDELICNISRILHVADPFKHAKYGEFKYLNISNESFTQQYTFQVDEHAVGTIQGVHGRRPALVMSLANLPGEPIYTSLSPSDPEQRLAIQFMKTIQVPELGKVRATYTLYCVRE